MTAGNSDVPTIKQLSVFMTNQVGALLKLTRCLDALGIDIRAVSIIDAVDHAVARLIVDRPGLAHEALVTEGYAVCESDLIGVQLPRADSGGIRQVLSALLLAELNVHYVYSLMTGPMGVPILALHVEDNAAATRVLTDKRLTLVGQDQLR